MRAYGISTLDAECRESSSIETSALGWRKHQVIITDGRKAVGGYLRGTALIVIQSHKNLLLVKDTCEGIDQANGARCKTSGGSARPAKGRHGGYRNELNQ